MYLAFRALVIVLISSVFTEAKAIAPTVKIKEMEGPSPSVSLPLYIDLHPATGYGTLSGMGLTKNQTLISSGASLTIGTGEAFLFGVVADYRQYGQQSEVNSYDGNFQGSRTFFAPTLGLRFESVVIKVNYQMSGDYRLGKKTASDTDLVYGEPKGWQAALLYELGAGFHIGLHYETLSFSNRTETGSSPVKLETPLTLNQFGLGVAYVY